MRTLRDPSVRRLLLTHFLGVIGEWAVTVGLLVHAFTWGGSKAVGVAASALLVPPFAVAPVVGAAMARWRTQSIRLTALATQAVAYSAGGLAAALDAPTPVVAPFVVIGLSAMTAIPPTTAALLPHLARSAGDLVSGNLWVTYCDSASALVGSLVAGVLVGAGGPQIVFVVAAAWAATGLLATWWRAARLVRAARSGNSTRPRRVIVRTLAELRSHPWSVGVLAVASARNLIVGSFDVLLVIVAIEVLGLGDGGSGYLGALVGGGALVSTLVTTGVVRRAKLRPALMVAVVVAAAFSVALGLRTDRPVVLIALPVIGLAMASMDALARTILQRSTDPRSLGPLYAAVGFVAGLGQIAGAVIAQVMVAIGDVRLALIVLGGLLVALAVITVRSIRRAESHADVPAMEMALLAGLPMLASVRSNTLERVARSTETVRLEPGEAVVVEGGRVDACYVVADGEFDITVRGTRLRRAGRGDVIGEVALLTGTTATTSVHAASGGSVVRIDRQAFLVALTGHDVQGSTETLDFAVARQRFREVVAAHRDGSGAESIDRAEAWLSLGASGRVLGDPTYTEALARTASLATATSNEVLLAEAAAMTTWPGAFFHIAEQPDQQLIALCEAALGALPANDPLRPRVLAALASNLTFASSAQRRAELIAEAHELAERLGDPALVGAVLNAEFVCLWEPATLARREVIASRLVGLAAEIDDPELAYLGGFFAAYCQAERGQLAEARRRLVELRALLPATNNQYFEFLGDRLIVSIDIACGEQGAQLGIDALAARHAASVADTDGTWALQTGALAYQAGTLGTMVPVIIDMVGGPHSGTWPAALALAQMMTGDTDAATATLTAQGDVPRTYFWVTVAQVQAEVAAHLGLVTRCGELFEQLLAFRGLVGITASGSLCFGLVSRSLGELALAMGRLEDAAGLLGEAVDAADAAGMVFESVVSRRLLASALHQRGEHDRAQRVASAAVVVAASRGFAREQRMLDDLAAPGAAST